MAPSGTSLYQAPHTSMSSCALFVPSFNQGESCVLCFTVCVPQAGPEGCGKATLLDYCFSRLPGKVTVARVHCSAQTTADHVIQKLLQV